LIIRISITTVDYIDSSIKNITILFSHFQFPPDYPHFSTVVINLDKPGILSCCHQKQPGLKEGHFKSND